jgi:hypothetical protein
MKKALLMLLVGGFLIGTWGVLPAVVGASKDLRPFRPVAVFSLASYDKTLDNLAMLGRAVGKPEMTKDLVTVLKLLAIQQGLVGPAKDRPWGVTIQSDNDGKFTGCAFVPSTDLSKLASIMEPFVGKAESIGGNIYKIRGDSTPVYITQRDDWAFFAYHPEDLDSLPTDPMAALDGLNMEYDLAARFYAGNVPAKYRERLATWIQRYADPFPKQGVYEPDRLYQLRKQMTSETVRPILAAVNDADTLTIGWRLDVENKKSCLEWTATAKDGSETAKGLAKLLDVKSEFKGFRLPDATLTANWAVQLPAFKSTAPDAFIETFRVLAIEDIDEHEKSLGKAMFAKQMAADVADLVLANIHKGRADGGLALVLKPDAVTLAAGGYVADTAKLTESLKRIAAAAKLQDPKAAEWIKIDAGEAHSVHFHTVSIPLPPETKERTRLVGLFGEKLELAVGIGSQSAYIAMGREPLATLKRIVELSASATPKDQAIAEVSLSLGSSARFVAASGKNERIRSLAGILAAVFEPAADRDHVKVSVRPVPRGVQGRLEIEEGPLKFVGRLGDVLSEDDKKK